MKNEKYLSTYLHNCCIDDVISNHPTSTSRLLDKSVVVFAVFKCLINKSSSQKQLEGKQIFHMIE